MVRKAFLLFGDLCQSLPFAVYMNQNGSDRYFLYFFTFLVIAGHKGEKESLEHGKTWFGKLFCRLLIYSNLQSLPCICIKIVPTGTFFTFLVIRTWQSTV